MVPASLSVAFTLMLTFNMVCSVHVLTAMHCIFYSHLVRYHVSESFCCTAYYLCARMITEAFLDFLTTEKKLISSLYQEGY
jgi:hypothetical protein